MKLLLLPIITVLVLGLTFNIAYSQESEEYSIPQWIRTAAGFWASGIISDEQYTNSLEYMIHNGLVNVNLITTATAPTTTLTGTNPPDWIKTLAGLWASELTADQEYLNAIKYLIDNELITINITSSIKGTVTDSNGIGISGAIVTIGTENTFTNSDGTYEISGLNAGTYTVTVIPPIGLTETRQVTLTVGNNTVDFTLGIIPSILGTVTDTDGNGIAGVTIRTLSGSSTTTDANGMYSFENIDAGNQDVFITLPDGYELIGSFVQNVTVTEGQTATVDFNLINTQIGNVTGFVSGSDGLPINGATVTISTTPENSTITRVGIFTFSNITPGSYTITITADGYIAHTEVITVTAGGEARITPTLIPVTPPAPVTPTSPPDAPTNLKGVSEDDSLRLTWNAPRNTGSSAIIDYKIEWKRNTSTVWNTLNDSQSTRTNSTITGLTDGIQYNFRVSAVNSNGESLPSNVITITKTKPISTPTKEIIIDSCGRDNVLGTAKVTGRYTPDGDYTVVQLSFVILSSDGGVVEVFPHWLTNVSKGETKSFSIISFYEGSFNSCKVEIAAKF